MIANDSHETPGLPSSADLDAAEERVREATGGDWREEMCVCGCARHWHSLDCDIWVPSLRGCLSGARCGCKAFVKASAPAVEDSQAFEELKRGAYVASRASIPERAEMWRTLRDSGFPITSSWIDEAGEGQTSCLGELWERIAAEVKASSALVLYVEPDDLPLKGALIEVGMALALNLPVVAVMPGVVLEPRSLRPIGSWLNHPNVRIMDDIPAAVNYVRRQIAAQTAATPETT